jgi:hypothetical protein
MSKRAISPALSARAQLWCAILAGIFTGWAAVLGDGLARESWQGVDLGRHLRAGLALHAAVGAVIGIAAWLACRSAALSGRWLRRRSPRLALAMPPVVTAVVATLLVRDTAEWTFRGSGVQATALAAWGPYAFMALCGLGVAALTVVSMSALVGATRGRLVWPALASMLLLLGGAALAAIDLTVYVALYRRLHILLELFATMAVLAGLGIALVSLRRRFHGLRLPIFVAAAFGVFWLGAFACFARVRARVDVALGHVWREPAYLGRTLMRVQLAEAFLRDPAGWRGAQASRIDRLKSRFDLATMTLSPRWHEPQREAPGSAEAAKKARRHIDEPNIVVFYIDTLRDDVARDATTMPSLAKLRKKSLDFLRAYSFASDTVTALPVLMNGNYFPAVQDGDVLALARKNKVNSALIIPSSARQFLAKLVPRFTFDDTVEVPDYAPHRDVWGYGADLPSADVIASEALAWIDRRASQRFFAWLFHFDVHNWRELDDSYVDQVAQSQKLTHSDRRWLRYHAAAAGVDAALERIVAGLAERGLDDRTVIVVVSDHGEALGRQGHWNHAVFLWESLVRTPLVIHVPHTAAKVIDAPVGHVDVAPTLARFIDPDANVSRYHGYDLYHHVVGEPPVGALPLLLMSLRKDDLMRVGLIDRQGPFYKLILPLESAEPELYDLETAEPDDGDVATKAQPRMLRMLSDLVRSPVFPREAFEAEDKKDGATAALH